MGPLSKEYRLKAEKTIIEALKASRITKSMDDNRLLLDTAECAATLLQAYERMVKEQGDE
jgi:hypothetical protein